MQDHMIFIPTHKRLDNQKTWSWIPEKYKSITKLVVGARELMQHKKRKRNCVLCPVQGQGMAVVREWILDYATKHNIAKIIMMDDDLYPRKRRLNGKILSSNESQVVQGIDWLFDALDEYVHAAWSERSYNWIKPEPFRIGTKGTGCVSYNVSEVLKSGCRFIKGLPQTSLMQDYHMTLQLLEAGFPNKVSFIYRYGTTMSGTTDGGNLEFRTQAHMEECAKRLELLHPQTVKAVVRTTKKSFGGGSRWDIRVRWQKAYHMGLKKQEART